MYIIEEKLSELKIGLRISPDQRYIKKGHQRMTTFC